MEDLGRMKPAEVREMMQKLRNSEEVLCPQCRKGKIVTPYDPKTSKSFKCNNNECGFTITYD